MRPCPVILSSWYCLIFCAKVGALLRPFGAFDHAAIHVGDVDRAVGPGRHVGRTEQRIERADELGARVDVLQLREPLGLDRPQSPDDAGDDFAVEVVADQILRQPIAAIDLVAGGGGGVDQRAVGHARARESRPGCRRCRIGAPHTMFRSGSN